MNKRIDKIHKRICTEVRSMYTMVDVLPKQGLFNYRCYFNAVEYAKLHKGVGVVEVIYIENEQPVLHYLNRKNKTGELLETTLGFMADNLEYYVIKEVHESDYKHIYREFERSLEAWLMRYSNWFDRKMLGVERVV